MTLDKVFAELSKTFHALDSELEALSQFVVEDRPVHPANEYEAAQPVQDLSDKTQEVHDNFKVAMVSADECYFAIATNPSDMLTARRVLGQCHDLFNTAAKQFSDELFAFDEIEKLIEFGLSDKGKRLRWALGAIESLARCRRPIDTVTETLFVCWQELTDRLGAGGTSIQNTTVGQSIRNVAAPGRHTSRQTVS